MMAREPLESCSNHDPHRGWRSPLPTCPSTLGAAFASVAIATAALTFPWAITPPRANAQPPAGNSAQPPAGKSAQPPAGNNAQPPAGNSAQSPVANEAQPPAVDTRVAAKVEGQPITVGEVLREVERVVGRQATAPDLALVLRAEALAKLVDRQLILRNLERSKLAASTAEVDLMVSRLQGRLEPRRITLAQHLTSLGLDEGAWRRQIAWQVSWERYLERYLTDENLARYFAQHIREFDGSRLRVAHILFAAPQVDPQPDSTPEQRWWARHRALEQTIAAARAVRAEIQAGRLSFADAARKHSVAPTGAEGGDIGWIGRREPMPESFSRAAFSLEKGGVSEPVVTAFGVHVIQFLDAMPGDKKWQDVRGDVEAEVTRYLFDWLAEKERSKSAIEFTNVLPHFVPGTRKLARADAS